MKYRLNQKHQNDNNSPINVSKGSKVKLGEKSDDLGPWPNWIYCYSLDGNGEGWTPIQIIHIEDQYGTVTENYCAYELEVSKDEIVEGFHELNGWLWCMKSNGLYGWLPKDKLEII